MDKDRLDDFANELTDLCRKYNLDINNSIFNGHSVFELKDALGEFEANWFYVEKIEDKYFLFVYL